MGLFSRRDFALLSATTSAALAAGLDWAPAQTPRRGGTLIIPEAGGGARHLNPAVQSGVATAVPGTQIFASPLRFDGNWRPQPYLAKSWDLAADGKSLTLRLIEGATFHDGKPITSEDVAFSVMTVKKYHPFQQMFAPVASVETPDAHTAVIRLSRPHPALLLAMSPALCPILPKHVFDDGVDLRNHPANSAPVGSGPFKLVEFKRGEHTILERNDKFFIPDRPLLDRIIFRYINDPTAIMLAMERGEAHMVPYLSTPRDTARMARHASLSVSDKGFEGIGALTWLAFNTQKAPLDDKRVRQAICFAIDRNFILKRLLLDRAKAATGPIAPNSPFYTADVEKYDLNLDKANQLLDQAGHKRKSDGTRFTLTVDYSPGNEVVKSTAEYFKPQLRKVGIDVQVRTSPDFATWAHRVGGWDFDLTLDTVFNWGDPVIGVDRTYLSSNIRKGVIWSNTQGYSNPRVDELLAKAGVEPDLAARKALYAEFQKIVVDDAPIFFINTLPYVGVFQKTLGAVPATIWGAMSPMDELHWTTPPR
ncbi:MAG: ABC transporter substrate-binding protein [Phreatobacter sp.]|uniref:ABC transporter substrate-binding protein n=1 Tax=Phreatobacter sp. TaxID=1966341 RepID=UPI001A4A0AB9|nr:ABC transporter substrate-binding protein [Phreatobacter sp.]MBL8571130.1 ABC transporter substrate-binding protein [Phreatobacter sp.]